MQNRRATSALLPTRLFRTRTDAGRVPHVQTGLQRLAAAIAVSTFLPLAALAQIATYDFDGDLTDSTGSQHASSQGTVQFLSDSERSWVKLGSDGTVSMPVSLSDGLLDEGSFSLTLDLRFSESEGVLPVGTGSAPANPAYWEQAGVRLIKVGTELILTFDDGAAVDGYVWQGVLDPVPMDQWFTVKLLFNPASRNWQVQSAGTQVSGTIPETIDVSALIAGIEANPITLGGQGGERMGSLLGDIEVDQVAVHSPADFGLAEVQTSLDALRDHILGTVTLTEQEQADHAAVVVTSLAILPYDSISASLWAYSDAYEAAFPPMYADGVLRSFADLSPLEQVLQTCQQWVLKTRFVADHVATMAGVAFEHREVHPGLVAPGARRQGASGAQINGSYNVDPAAELTAQEFVLRPTGHYLAGGDIVTITFPASVVGQGMAVVVGAHSRDMAGPDILSANRFPDIGTEFPVDATDVPVGNPMGGGIYIRVPAGSTAGLFNITIDGAVTAPYFSARAVNQTDVNDWLAEVASSGAPWADFESDSIKFSVPTSVLGEIDQPDQIMQRWNAIMAAVDSVAGRPPANRPRAEYLVYDTHLVTPAYGSGYPMVFELPALLNQPLSGWNPLDVLEVPAHSILMHEMGHNQLHPTMNFGDGFDPCHTIEAETIVHTLQLAALHDVYGRSTEDAFLDSFIFGLTLDEATFDWIITSNFRQNLPMDFDLTIPMEDQDMLKYQSRGWAKYAELARTFGWPALRATNGAFYQAGSAQEGTACDWRPFVVSRDEYIAAASAAVGENLAPFFHFWGIQPSPELAADLMSTYPKSARTEQMLLDLRCRVAPKTFAEYHTYHDQMYDRMGYQQPRYDEYITQFDAAFAAEIDGQFDVIASTYGLANLTCGIFEDDFESGGTMNWSSTSP